MDETLMMALGNAGAYAAIAIAALGSALGTGAAGSAAVGAWKKCYAQNKPAPFQLAVFAGAPLSQTIYGMIIMFLASSNFQQPEQWPFYLSMGIVGGIAMGASAWMQGKAAAGACDAFADTGKGFTNYLMALGIIETVAIFAMAFAIVIMSSAGALTAPFGVAVNEYKKVEGKDKPEIIELKAVQETPLLAKVKEPVDTKLSPELVIAAPAEESITVTAIPCDEQGNIRSGTKPAAAVTLSQGANKIAVADIQDKEKKPLQPGTYVLKIKAGGKTADVFVKLGVEEQKQ